MNFCGQSNIFKRNACLCLIIVLTLVLDFVVATVPITACQYPSLSGLLTETAAIGEEISTLVAPVQATWSIKGPLGLKDLFEISKTNITSDHVLKLKEQLDLENPAVLQKMGGTNYIHMQLECDPPTNAPRTLPLSFAVVPVNEHWPEFNTSSIHIWTKENVPSSQVLLHLREWVSDKDVFSGVKEEITHFALSKADVPEEINGVNFLELNESTGYMSVQTSKNLDYDTLPKDQKFVMVDVTAYDFENLQNSSTIIVHVQNEDEFGPVFYYPGCSNPCDVQYTVTVAGKHTGPLTGELKPAPIQAKDGDDTYNTVTFVFTKGPPGYEEYMSLDPQTGDLSVLKELENYQDSNEFVLVIKATENDTELERFAETTLLVKVLPTESTTSTGVPSPDADTKTSPPGADTKTSPHDADTKTSPYGADTASHPSDGAGEKASTGGLSGADIAAIIVGTLLMACVVTLAVALAVVWRKWKNLMSVSPERRPSVDTDERRASTDTDERKASTDTDERRASIDTVPPDENQENQE